ncbi:thioredoxin family protein [Novipirellula artificiosorum]|nr:DUF255 domain-containing protein [Novipirellula artificiosorum]
MISASTATADIQWQENLRAAHSAAQAENKLLLLHFYSDDCVWCDRLEAGSFQSPDVAEAIGKDFVAVKVHANKNPQLLKMFKVTAFPTDVIVTTEGKTLSHSVSPQAPARYVAMLKATVPSIAPAGQQNPTGPMVAQQPVQQTAPAASAPGRFEMPTNPPGGVQGHLTGSRVDRTMPAMPEFDSTMASVQPATTGATSEQAIAGGENKVSASPDGDASIVSGGETKHSELAMEGFCAVTVINEDRWVEGKPEFGVVHLGKLYLFAGKEAMQAFLSDPVTYTPVLNEIDVVRFFEEHLIVPGKREWGLKDPTHNRMFFFADEAAMNHFWNEHQRYTDAAIDVMNKAVKDANPGT